MKEFTMNELFPLIEEGIKNGGKYRFYPKGVSMLPLIREGIDSVVLEEAGEVEKYDMILYLRDDGSFVLHRVVRVKNGRYFLCGDNQCVVERDVRPDQVKAFVSGFYRKEKYVSVEDTKYLKYVRRRVASIRLRRGKAILEALISKIKG